MEDIELGAVSAGIPKPIASLPSLIRLWPVFVYIGFCLLLALEQGQLLAAADELGSRFSLSGSNQLRSGLMFGQAMGASCILVIIAGLCGRQAVPSLGSACLVAVFIFVALFGLDETLGEDRVSQLFYAYNLPVLVLGASLPLLIARFATGRFLTRTPGASAIRSFRIDQLLMMTTVVACLILYCRVPMRANHLSPTEVFVYLPGLVLIMALASLITVLPSVFWVFHPKLTIRQFVYFVSTSALGMVLLCASFNLLLGKWMPVRFDSVVYALAILSFLVLYTTGVFALRVSGFRWVQPDSQLRQYSLDGNASASSRIGWLWTAGFMLTAITSGIPISRIQQAEKIRFEKDVEWITEIREAGGKASWQLDRIFSVHIPEVNTEPWLERLSELPSLSSLTLTGEAVDDALVERLLRKYPTIRIAGLPDTRITDRTVKLLIDSISHSSLDLSGTRITDESLELLKGVRQLRSLDLSRTNISVSAIADLLSDHPQIIGITLNDLKLDDDQFAKIYQPRSLDWGLAGNRLTARSVERLFQHGAYRVDLTGNPGVQSIVGNLATGVPIDVVVLDNVPIGDAEIARWIAIAPPEIIVLGKTNMTLVGLQQLISTCGFIQFKEDSFSEDQLGQLSTLGKVPRTISFSDASIKGDFLMNWNDLPVGLDTSGSSFSDAQLARLSQRSDWKPQYIGLQGSGITDASLPILEQLQPSELSVQGTQVTAKGLLKCSFPNTRILMSALRFSYEELDQLRTRFDVRFLDQ